MYPCVELNYSYGYALTGLDKAGGLPVTLEMSEIKEPNIRVGTPPANLTGKVTCQGTKVGSKHGIYRFKDGNVGVPADLNDYELVAEGVFHFVADTTSYVWYDPNPIVSSTAVAYRCVEIQATFL